MLPYKNGSHRYKHLVVNGGRTFFTNEETSADKKYDETLICQMLDFLINNIYIEIGKKEQNLEFDIYYESTQNTIPRISNDRNINPYGRKLIETCVSYNPRIANGRINGDCLGQMTCYNYK